MQRRTEQWQKPSLTDIEISQFVTCSLCNGYKIDCTALRECHHSFCRTCIVTRLRKTRRCPYPHCGLMMSIQPFKDLKEDNKTQNIIYQLVSGLRLKEGLRRKQFWDENPVLKELHQDAVSRDLELLNEYPDSQVKRVPICLKHLRIQGKKLHSKSLWKALDSPFKKFYIRLPNSAPIEVVEQLIRVKLRVFYDQYDPRKIEVIFISNLNNRAFRHNLTIQDVLDTMSSSVESTLYYSVFVPMSYYKSISTNTISSQEANGRQICSEHARKTDLADLSETTLSASESELIGHLSEESVIPKKTTFTERERHAVQKGTPPSNTTKVTERTEPVTTFANLRKAFTDNNSQKRKIIPGQYITNDHNETSANKKPKWDVSDFLAKQNRFLGNGHAEEKSITSPRVEEAAKPPEINVRKDVGNQIQRLKTHKISRASMESARDDTLSVAPVFQVESVINQRNESAVLGSTALKTSQSMLKVDIGQRGKNTPQSFRFPPRRSIDSLTKPRQNNLRIHKQVKLVMTENESKQNSIPIVKENTNGITRQHPFSQNSRLNKSIGSIGCMNGTVQRISGGLPSTLTRKPTNQPLSASSLLRKSLPARNRVTTPSRLSLISKTNVDSEKMIKLTSTSPNIVFSSVPIHITRTTPVNSSNNKSTRPIQTGRHKLPFGLPIATSANIPSLLNHSKNTPNILRSSKQHSLPQPRVPNLVLNLTSNPVPNTYPDSLIKRKQPHASSSVITSISLPGKSISPKQNYYQQLKQRERIGRGQSTESSCKGTSDPNAVMSLNQQTSFTGAVAVCQNGRRKQVLSPKMNFDDNSQSPQKSFQYTDEMINDPNDEVWKEINSEISIRGVYSVAQNSSARNSKDTGGDLFNNSDIQFNNLQSYSEDAGVKDTNELKPFIQKDVKRSTFDPLEDMCSTSGDLVEYLGRKV